MSRQVCVSFAGTLLVMAFMLLLHIQTALVSNLNQNQLHLSPIISCSMYKLMEVVYGTLGLTET